MVEHGVSGTMPDEESQGWVETNAGSLGLLSSHVGVSEQQERLEWEAGENADATERCLYFHELDVE